MRSPPIGTRVIGASLSFCVRDILLGVVRESDVVRIYTSCSRMYNGGAPRDEIVARYKETYWRNHLVDPKTGEGVDTLLTRLYLQGKIIHCGGKALVDQWITEDQFLEQYQGSWLEMAKADAKELGHEEPQRFTKDDQRDLIQGQVNLFDSRYSRLTGNVITLGPDTKSVDIRMDLAEIWANNLGQALTAQFATITSPRFYLDERSEELMDQLAEELGADTIQWVVTDPKDPLWDGTEPVVILK